MRVVRSFPFSPWSLAVGGSVMLLGLLIVGGCAKKDDEGDTTPPVVTMVAARSQILVGDCVKVIVQASETIVPLTVASFQVQGGMLVSVTQDEGNTCTLLLRALATSAVMQVTLPAGNGVDLSGNRMAAPVSTQINVTPIVAMQVTDLRQDAGKDVVEVRFAFSEPVTGFAADDVVITNGAAGSLIVDGDRAFRLSITVTEGDQPLRVGVVDGAAIAASQLAVVGMPSIDVDLHPTWASATGCDTHGLWADLSITGHDQTAVQRFRWIPAGTFIMGTPDTELERWTTEGPQHLVTLTKSYWLADTECTQRFWLAVTGGSASSFPDDGLEMPVNLVNWKMLNETGGFFEALNALVPGLAARLPTEAQWEYACRARTVTPFALPVVDATTINCHPDVDDPYIATGTFRNKPVPVKSLGMANAWGLFDMHGNVFEWCQEKIHRYTSEAQIDPDSAGGDIVAEQRVLRSGACFFVSHRCRSGARGSFGEGGGGSLWGFRMLVPVNAVAGVMPRSMALARHAVSADGRQCQEDGVW